VEGIPSSPETAFIADPTQDCGIQSEATRKPVPPPTFTQKMKAAGGAESGTKMKTQISVMADWERDTSFRYPYIAR